MAAKRAAKKASRTKKAARKAAPARKAASKSSRRSKAARPARAVKRAAKRVVKRAAPRKQKAVRGLVVERPKGGAQGPRSRSRPPPPPADAVEVSGIYERVLYSEDDPYAEVRELFGHYDRDRSGSIEAPEFARVCEALGVELSEDELEVGLSIVDADGDGRISWDEFLGWWQAR